VRYLPQKKLSLSHEPSIEWIERRKDDAALSYRILDRRLVNEVLFIATPLFSFPLTATAGRSDGEQGGRITIVPYYLLQPGVTLIFSDKGRLEFTYEWVYVVTEQPFLYYEMAQGNAPGTTHRLRTTGQVALGKNMEGELQFVSEKEEASLQWVHRGRAQLKAFF